MKNLLCVLLLFVVNHSYAKDDLIKIKNYEELLNYIGNENKNNTEMQKVIYINDILNGIIEPNNIEKNKNIDEIIKSRVANYKDINDLKYKIIIDEKINKNKVKKYTAVYEDLETIKKINPYYIITYEYNNEKYILDIIAKELVVLEKRYDIHSLVEEK